MENAPENIPLKFVQELNWTKEGGFRARAKEYMENMKIIKYKCWKRTPD